MQYWNTIINKTLLLVLLSSLSITSANAQENSPYSRYGLGNIKQTENVANRGMGGVSIADDDPLMVNPTNPATFASLRLTSFQVGLTGSSVNVQNSSASNRTGSFNLEYVNIAFPINKHFGLSFGLLPQTRAKYNMSQSDTIDGISKVNYSYYGGGGTQKIYVGAAYKYKEYSIGISTGYLFGNVVNSTVASYTDSLKILSSSTTGRTIVGGAFLQAGALINQKLNEKYHIKLGASYTLSQHLNAKRDEYFKSFIGDVNTSTYNYNVDSVVESKGKIVLPSKLNLGVMFCKGEVWKIGLDFMSSNWESFRTYDQKDSTGKNWMIKLGGSLTPDATAVGANWKKVTYRAGLYNGQDILKFNGTNLPVMGVTVGLGYPIRRTINSIGQFNVALDLGKRGTTSNGLLSEGYTRFSIGFTVNDKWFIPRKYE